MGMTIEQARAAFALRKRLDEVDKQLAAKVPSQGLKVQLWFVHPALSGGGAWIPWELNEAEVAGVMEIRRNRLNAERLLILAEAVEQGLTIEDAPAIASQEIKA